LKKEFTKWKKIVNDAVVDDADRTLTVSVRMGVCWSWRPVSCPTGVCYPHFRLESVSGQNLLKPLYPPCLFNDGKFVSIQNSNPTRIIAAILKPFKPCNEDLYNIPFADVSEDTTHRCSPPNRRKEKCYLFPKWRRQPLNGRFIVWDIMPLKSTEVCDSGHNNKRKTTNSTKRTK